MTDFAATFQALTGHLPLPWQQRFFNELASGRLPSSIDLPTGLGKTSVIAIWLAARAVESDLPRRLIYVVDRRAVVDQATAVAVAVADALGNGTTATSIVHELRARLGLELGMRLPVSTLRGQYVDNREWLENPSLPAIVVGTIDMIGSRLLFQGYGVSSGMRSVHAGLLGADALLVLDEAHLVPPFEHLLRAVAAWPRTQGVPPFRLLTLSATGRTEGAAPFRLVSEDLQDARTSARLRAVKRLKVATTGHNGLEDVLSRNAFERAGSSSRVIVFCDSRKVAQKVADRIAKLTRAHFGKGAPAPALLVGARRVRERTLLENDAIFAAFKPADAGAPPRTTPAFLVATSAGEVGVDLDADHLVMDLVPWERMVQRLGRVNRRAEPGESFVDVFVSTPDKDAESGGDQDAGALNAWRAPFDSEIWSEDGEGRRDASPLSLLRLKENDDFAQLTRTASSREPLHPELSQPVLDAWALTSLDEHPGRPNVAPWLRGWIDEESQTRFTWRRLFPIRPGDIEEERVTQALASRLGNFFASAPPHLSEILEVPTFQAVDLLRKRIIAWSNARPSRSRPGAAPDVADLPLVIALDSQDNLKHAWTIHDLQDADVKDLSRLIAGKTVVLDARLGGLDEQGLLDDKFEEPPTTLDAASTYASEWARLVGFRIRIVSRASEPDADDLDWPIDFRCDLGTDLDDEGDELRVEVLRTKGATRGDAAVARKEQALEEHHRWTADAAQRIARALMLPADHERTLVAAAAVHDAGKAREVWQNAMRAPRAGRPYAKTRGGGDFRALILNGEIYRHEFGSVAEAEAEPSLQALTNDLRDLALHLVAAHHGYARPIIAAVDPEAPPSLTLERARTIALRFHRMHRVWGAWGLAWWESLLRAADWAASRAVNERKAQGR